MAKLDEKALDELIKEVLSEVAVKPDDYESDIDISTILPDGKWSNNKTTYTNMRDPTALKAIRTLSKQLYGNEGFIETYANRLLPASARTGKSSSRSAETFLFLKNNGFNADPANEIDHEDMLIKSNDGYIKDESGNDTSFLKLSNRGDIYHANMIRLEYLCRLANNGNQTVKEFLEKRIFHLNNMGFLQKLYFATEGWSQQTKANLRAALPEPEDVKLTRGAERGVVSDPSMASQRAERGTRLDSEFSIFESFRVGDSISETIKKLSDFSLEIANKGPTSPATEPGTSVSDMRDFINKMLVLDYFVAFTKEIDSGSGAYFFESFLAYLSGGETAGKASGIAGGMGETDFIKGNGTKGSAKFLQRGSDVGQSIASFQIGQTIEYVVAYKKGSIPKGGSSPEKTSDPDKIRSFDIFVFNVTRIESAEAGMAQFEVEHPDGSGTKTLYTTKTTGDLKIKGQNLTKPVGTLYVTALDNDDTSSYIENLNKYTESVDNGIRQAYEAFRDLMKSLTQAKDKAATYASQTLEEDGFPNRIQAGKDALTAIKNSEAHQSTLIDLFDEKEQVAAETGSIAATEAKLAELDKLILEVLKNNS